MNSYLDMLCDSLISEYPKCDPASLRDLVIEMNYSLSVFTIAREFKFRPTRYGVKATRKLYWRLHEKHLGY